MRDDVDELRELVAPVDSGRLTLGGTLRISRTALSVLSGAAILEASRLLVD